MRRVRLFELENLSLSSAASLMKKSTISFATTLHAMGQPQENPTSVDTLEHWDIYHTEKEDQREFKQGRSKEHRIEVGCISVKESVFCPVAKLVMAFRWSSLIDSLGLYNTRMHRWLFKKNYFPSLQHK